MASCLLQVTHEKSIPFFSWPPSLWLLWWVPSEEARGRSMRGYSAAGCNLQWETDKVMTASWPGSVGIAWVSGSFPRPNGATPELPWPHRRGKIILGGNLWAERCAFQSNSISLSLLPLSSLSSSRAAWDVSVEVTCGEQCHVKSLWRLHQSPPGSNLSSELFSSHLIFISEWVL